MYIFIYMSPLFLTWLGEAGSGITHPSTISI